MRQETPPPSSASTIVSIKSHAEYMASSSPPLCIHDVPRLLSVMLQVLWPGVIQALVQQMPQAYITIIISWLVTVRSTHSPDLNQQGYHESVE